MDSYRMVVFMTLLSFIACHTLPRPCPSQCECPLDSHGRIQNICNRGNLDGIPIQSIDRNVEVLIIRGPQNHIKIGPIFGNFKHLEELRVTGSNVPAVGSFWNVKSIVPTLRILDLSFNSITRLQVENFHGLEHLVELNLSHNKIDSMTSEVFHYLSNLKRLNLADNAILVLVQRVFYHLNKLKYLDLSENPLAELPPDVFQDITELKKLKCRKCNLHNVNATVFNSLSNLIELDLGDNNFEYFDDDVFHSLRRLITLRLDGNRLSVISAALLPVQKSLEQLDLARNHLTEIATGAFTLLSNLTHLDLAYNKLAKLETASMEPLKKLQALNISGNIRMNLNKMRSTLQLFPKLCTLSVADMDVLPMDMFESLAHLKSVNLSGNHLSNTSLSMLDPVDDLELLDLSRNQVTGFSDKLVAKLREINDVKLADNPIVCDICHMGALVEIARTLQWNLYPVCYLPEHERLTPISDLNYYTLERCIEFTSDEQNDVTGMSRNIFQANGAVNWLTLIVGIGLVLMIAFVICFSLCMRRHSAKYYTNEDKRNDGLYEKNIDSLSITGNEISFKFPLDDGICTIGVDDMISPLSTPPPKPTFKSFTKQG